MSLINNLVKEAENNQNADDTTDPKDTDKEKTTKIIKSATDLQRLKLEKLMKNPNKIVLIPEPRKEKDFMQSVPTFVRNVMGSSAGAGSGEFHVYRHLRRKEYARQKMIQAKSSKQQLDEEYQQKLEDNRRKSEEKTAKKRAKRLKKKERAKRLRQQTSNNKTHDEKQNNSIDENSNDSNEETEVEENDNDSCQMNTKLMNEKKHENFNSNKEANIEENDCPKQNEDTMKDLLKPTLDVDSDQVLNDCDDNAQAMEEGEKSICQDKTKQCEKLEVEDKEYSEENKKPITQQEDCPEDKKMETSQNNSKEMNNEK